MSKIVLILVLGTFLGCALTAKAAEPQLSHAVFFKLKESTDANQKKLMEACHKYLDKHEGTVYFGVGALAKDLKREVNDLDFDVSLIVVFRDRAAHDTYQTHPRHLKFIEECQSLWSGVRVFDSYLPPTGDQ